MGQTNSSSDSKDHLSYLQIPTILSSEFEGFNWFFYEEYKDLLTSNGQIDESILLNIKPFLKEELQSFRIQLVLKSVPFLVGIFKEEKEIRFYSQNLSYELFLCHYLEEGTDLIGPEVSVPFKRHTEKVALLSPQEFPSVIEVVTSKNGLTDFLKKGDSKINKKTEKIIKELLIHVNKYCPSLFERFTDFCLSLTAEYALLRIHLLKFLAILPSLDHDKKGSEVKRMLLESFRRLHEDSNKAQNLKSKGENKCLPHWLSLVFSCISFFSRLIPAFPLAYIVRQSVRIMAKRFIAGETIELAENGLNQLFSTQRDVTLDQLGELVVSEKEADHYMNEVIKLIKGFSLHVKKGEMNSAGINRAHVSIKVSALCSDFRPYAPDYTYELVAPRLSKILLMAKDYDVFINIDAEHYDYRDIVFWIYKRVLLETKGLEDFSKTGIVLQAYLRDGYKHFCEILELAIERKILMPIRLVKGAYWDAETVEADAHGFCAPEFLNKEETDIHFRQLVVELLKEGNHLQLCLASHNFADHSFAEAIREVEYPTSPVIEHQCLHMTYEALSTALAKMGWPVRNYVPVGSLLVGMAYLVRRIMENSSQVGVLTIMRSHQDHKIMETPAETHLHLKKVGQLNYDPSVSLISDEFFNVSPTRLYLEEERSWVFKELEKFKKESLGKFYENGFNLSEGAERVNIACSSEPELNVGSITFANKFDAKKAVQESYSFYNLGIWARSKAIERASILTKAANLFLVKRNELASLIVFEAGKSILEALADVDEAIDFLNFYAREEMKLDKKGIELCSRGVVAVIAPWNFPLAIPCGMVSSALVAGNTVILKSAEQTPLISQKMVDLFYEAGLPERSLIHLPGLGETVGESLVNDNRISSIVFTGSRAVGIGIAKKASHRVIENEVFRTTSPVKVITEMGGKNAIIVTGNAELDETVSGILYSAYGHAGQKCSAASRILVDNKIKDRLIERLKEASLDIKVGRAFDFSTYLNPVITKEDQNRIRFQVKEAIDEANRFNGKVHVDRTLEKLPGYCVGPAIIELPTQRAFSSDSFSQREIFGPVVHIIGFDGLLQALEIYNATPYALTGGIFSQSQDDIDFLLDRMETGNIYVNRTITGARVAIEPFGGFKMSGTGPKAGSTDYMETFHLQPINLPEKRDLIKESLSDEDGSEYRYELCLPTKLSHRDNLKNFDNGLTKLINNFENLFEGIYVENKIKLQEFKDWIYNHSMDLKKNTHDNKVIPGQLSYNDYLISHDKVVILAFEQRAYFSSLLQFLGALSLGLGVTILARNEQSKIWWEKIISLFRPYGFDKKQVDIYFTTEENMVETLKNPELGVVIIDGNEKKLLQILPLVYENIENSKWMKRVLTPFDSPAISDFRATLKPFLLVRSFAINTMRHGAPLNLDLPGSRSVNS